MKWEHQQYRKLMLCQTRPHLHKLIENFRHFSSDFKLYGFFHEFLLLFSFLSPHFPLDKWTMFLSTISPWWNVLLAPLHLAVRYVYSFQWLLLFAIQTMAVKNFMDARLKSIFLPLVVPLTFNVEMNWIITWKFNQKQYHNKIIKNV